MKSWCTRIRNQVFFFESISIVQEVSQKFPARNESNNFRWSVVPRVGSVEFLSSYSGGFYNRQDFKAPTGRFTHEEEHYILADVD